MASPISLPLRQPTHAPALLLPHPRDVPRQPARTNSLFPPLAVRPGSGRHAALQQARQHRYHGLLPTRVELWRAIYGDDLGEERIRAMGSRDIRLSPYMR